MGERIDTRLSAQSNSSKQKFHHEIEKVSWGTQGTQAKPMASTILLADLNFVGSIVSIFEGFFLAWQIPLGVPTLLRQFR
ncbi:ATV_HP_G0014940.mRNA.1.CDS.1 [Saccharomyces cerevisiae]|nr:ATV_HP_G0014940.mRNA.1.CDS.1 [Saccharomyces cerevisiae]CAI6949899.1 ATV_HP_G0014940.mRNA.1.CDS.1 [Saccharomyces cerevisiae]